ncbi:hypothetical protein Tco_1340185 [Tanacetum coccineum]
MAESSSQNPSSPRITPKEEPVTLDKPESPNSFLHADQVEFTFDEITFTTNNEVDYAKLIWEDIIHNLNKKTREKVVPYPSVHNWALKPNQTEGPSLTDHMKAICNLDVPVDSKAPKPSSQTEEDKSPSHPSPPTSVVGEMHKEAQQAAGGPTSLGATSEEGAGPQLSSGHDASADSTVEADAINPAPNDSIPPQQVQIRNKPITVSDESEEEVEADNDTDTHATSHDSQKDELEQQKAKAEVASLKARPSYPDINQLTDLLVTSLKPELSKLLSSHNFASCLPTELKELLPKFTELSGEIKELKQHVKDMEIEQPRGLKRDSNKTGDFHFHYLQSYIPGATTKDVPSTSQATVSPAEGEKNTKDAETNLQNELVDLLGIDVLEQYHNKKLLFDKYCDKMLKRRKSSKIINNDVLTQKGPISLKVYREDETIEVIKNFKVSDLHLAKWRGVVQACPDRKEKG